MEKKQPKQPKGKGKQVRISLGLLDRVQKTYPETEKFAVAEALEGYMALGERIKPSLRGVFSRQEMLGIVQSFNGTMFDHKFATIPDVFIAHLEDSERYEYISRNFGFDFPSFIAKAKSLTTAQIYFLQEDISVFWKHNSAKEGALEEFLKRYL